MKAQLKTTSFLCSLAIYLVIAYRTRSAMDSILAPKNVALLAKFRDQNTQNDSDKVQKRTLTLAISALRKMS